MMKNIVIFQEFMFESLGHDTLETKAPQIYTVRKISEMSALSVNNFAIDVNPLVRFWKWNLPVNTYGQNALKTRGGILKARIFYRIQFCCLKY